MLTMDLFSDDFNEPIVPNEAPWSHHACVFDDAFWPEVVAKMWREAGEDPVKLISQLIIVPDASMYLPFQAAWAAHAARLKRPCIMPRMLTLLDWAKSAGASDVDMQLTERVLNWMVQLRDTPQLAQWLGATEDVHLFDVARGLIEMSDELSLQLLAGKEISSGEAALTEAVDAVFETNAGVFARQELAILLQCWRADVGVQSPVLKYLQTLAILAESTPAPVVWVVRNRAWANFEHWFWRAYALNAKVNLLDVESVRARVDAQAVDLLHKAWPQATRIINATTQVEKSKIRVLQADNQEDEAQAIAQQVLTWREQGARKIALVALDRQVSRRVWALLARAGVAIRDDTGWLLATARTASSWRMGLNLWQGDVLAVELLDWLSHPMVLANLPLAHKELLVRHFRAVALAQNPLARTWQAWLNAFSSRKMDSSILAEAELVGFDVKQAAIDVIGHALNTQAAWRRTFTLSQWSEQMVRWGEQFGMVKAWQNDPAGSVWLTLLEKWRGAQVKVQLDLSTFLRISDSEVEATTFRPHDVSDEVLLLPLGSTRMRDFDAVWLMGADSKNLPGNSLEKGLLNMAVRIQLGLPTHLDQQEQAKHDFIDLLAVMPQVVASFCNKKDGSPNSVSPWLAQWLRLTADKIPASIEIDAIEVQPQVQNRSQVSVANHVPVEVTASDLGKLAACPYQYFAQVILKTRLNELPSEEVSPADKGNIWHKVIAKFHERRDIAQPSQDIELLKTLIHAQIKPLCAENARYWAVLEQQLMQAEPYVAWWHARESDGWVVRSSELKVAIPYGVEVGEDVKPLNWKGVIDQVETRSVVDDVNGVTRYEQAVLDYKSGNVAHYLKSIKDNDDVQLAFYLNLFNANERQQITQAGYIGVATQVPEDRKKPSPHAGDTYYPQAWLNPSLHEPDNRVLLQNATQLHEKVEGYFQRMYDGEQLAAMGELKACAWCDVRGLCRKGYTKLAVSDEN